MAIEFPYEPGRLVMRNEIHKAIGGSFRHGMTSCLDQSAFVIFHNPDGGRRYGYDVWEGFDVEGNFHFTGQGKVGDQKLSNNNKKLLETKERGLPVHLFMTTGDGRPYTYFGEYCLGSPAFSLETAPDEIGNSRRVFVFNLIPVGRTWIENSAPVVSVNFSTSTWKAPPIEDLAKVSGSAVSQRVVQREHQIQKAFGEYLIQLGCEVLNASISVPGATGSVRPDFYIKYPACVIEAKGSSNRDFVRQSIGQVLDYRNLLSLDGIDAQSVLLLPTFPSDDLVRLILSLNIELIVGEDKAHFDFTLAPTMTGINSELLN